MSRVTFLHEFCEMLLKKHSVEGLSELTIVIPSQRVALYVREELQKLSDKSFWMPQIVPVNQFLEQLHDFTVIDELELVFELYEAYCESFESPDSFDDFLAWAPMIIADFNDIDKYLLDPKQVFRNLQSIKDIESWSFDTEELSDTQKGFLKFWERLGELYQKFHSRLDSKGEITNAQVYRRIAEAPEKYLASLSGYVYFIGFNALSVAEEKIIKFITNSGSGEAVWDVDDHYLSSQIMEAGKFVRKYSGWSKRQEEISSSHIGVDPKMINLYGANSNLQQVSIASQLISNSGEVKAGETALVFADESLLKPMLNVLPESLEQLNVAMGYPLNAASVFVFFEEAIHVQISIERYKSKGFLYYKDFLQVTNQEFFQLFLGNNNLDTSGIQKKINEENYAYLPLDLLLKEFGENSDRISFLFKKANDVVEFVKSFLDFLKEVYGLVEDNVLERESVLALIEVLEKVLTAQLEYKKVEKVTTLRQLTRQMLGNLKVSFLGEPLEGLQLLGLLETRALDFKRVILLSCNEDILPKRSFSNSLMPYDLRLYLGLPTRDDKDAIFAYYFYRLIQRAEYVDLVYNAGEADGLQANEISRYLLQVEEELNQDNIEVNHVVPKLDVDISTKELSTEISKDPFLHQRLLNYFEKGVSASGINQFNTCPKNFVYTQLLGLSKDEEIEEEIELSTYGTIVHEVLENLYKREGELIDKRSIQRMQKNYQGELKKSFDERFPGGNYLTGKNLLLYETAIHTIKKFFASELKVVEEHGVIKVLGLEVKKEKVLEVSTSRGLVKLKIKGLIDRVDQIGNVIRVVDYKTGKVDSLNFKGDWEKVTSYQLQLMTYLYLFDSDSDLASGMISLKQLSKGFQELDYKGLRRFTSEWIATEFNHEFEEYLSNFVERVVTSDFQHNPKSKYCVLC
ncbi:PD-(D/E)XK nuclease family protein [Parvicella tangerina]|uniref:PD-(D/E)XK endonuclease-like domain-containing protein n=1 Tax=Parvicella tangerina TaxID=2829795 RepID=A0A916JQT7_9FLAO|nr:PD-(D/E)XK nuclease family protein [Parvicella tangerina]CAG5085247.1 hypothetical protein CRYO30217_02699 [Parvicella tangerina]